jgi:ubiquinone/menaquinone biosynthesis C-methylase UbiE
VTEPDGTDRVASAYDVWARTYESVENATRDLASLALRRELAGSPLGDVLEIGCGTGLNTRHLAEHAQSVMALDFSAGMLAEARANVPASNVRFVENDLRARWQADDSSFDLVVCTLVLEHVEDLRHVFAEAARVLRPGGRFLLYELHPFRQMRGGRARFHDPRANEVVRIHAYTHGVSDFVNASVESGFVVVRLGEWRDEEHDAEADFPRLLSLHVRLPPEPV